MENIVHVGQKLSCREELFVRVSEDCEKVQKFYTARNTGAGGHTTKVGRAGTTSQYVNVVCRDDPACAYSVKASWFEDRSEKQREDAAVGWVVEEYSPHTCQGGAPPKKVSKNKGPAEESNAPSKKKGSKNAGNQAAKGSTSKGTKSAIGKARQKKIYAFSHDMLARAVRSTVLNAGRHKASSVRAVMHSQSS